MSTARHRLRERLEGLVLAELGGTLDPQAIESLAWTRLSELDPAVRDEAVETLDLHAIALAIASAEGDSSAIRAFGRRYFGAARAALRSMGIPDEMQADALAQTSEALFVTPGKGGDGPRILELVGKGDMQALVKVVAVRKALNLQRKDQGRAVDSQDALAEAIADQTSPEWGVLVGQHRGLIEEAFGAALSGLDAEARTMLRLSLLHGLSIDDLGAMHNIHRSTAARRLTKIRDTLRDEVRRRLQQTLGSDAAELESMLRVAQSGLDISFERLLAPDDA